MKNYPDGTRKLLPVLIEIHDLLIFEDIWIFCEFETAELKFVKNSSPKIQNSKKNLLKSSECPANEQSNGYNNHVPKVFTL